MYRYFKYHPRGFANEYTVYVVERPEDLESDVIQVAAKITRAEAIEWGIRKPNWAKRNSQQWFGGFACTAESEYFLSEQERFFRLSDGDMIAAAAIATREIIREAKNG